MNGIYLNRTKIPKRIIIDKEKKERKHQSKKKNKKYEYVVYKRLEKSTEIKSVEIHHKFARVFILLIVGKLLNYT